MGTVWWRIDGPVVVVIGINVRRRRIPIRPIPPRIPAGTPVTATVRPSEPEAPTPAPTPTPTLAPTPTVAPVPAPAPTVAMPAASPAITTPAVPRRVRGSAGKTGRAP